VADAVIEAVSPLPEMFIDVKHNQGHLVFHSNTHKGQRPGWLRCQLAARRRNTGVARAPQQPNSSIAECGHDLGNVAIAHLRPVFIKGDIPHPMGFVLDMPLAPHQLKQPCGWCLLTPQTGYSIDHFCPFLPGLFADHLPLQAADLG
jgi:hypothetical protein